MAEIVQGRRLPDTPYHTGLFGSFARGDYCNVGGEWWCRPPRGAIGPLINHTITEHEDGTITVAPSILMPSSNPRQYWHGYLEHGVWREI